MNYKITLRTFLFIAFLSAPNFISAQTASGTLIDKKDNKTIPFATVQLGENYGVVTNQEGDFSINTAGFSETDSLVFSSMGYDRKAIALKDFENGKIYLTKNVEELGEVLLMNRKLTALEVMEKVKENLQENHDFSFVRFTVFHRAKNTFVPHKMGAEIKKVSFVDRKIIKKFNRAIDSMENKSRGVATSAYVAYLSEVALGKTDSVKVRPQKATKLINKKRSNSMEQVQGKILNLLAKYVDSSSTFKVSSGILPLQDSLQISSLNEPEESVVDSLTSERLGFRMEHLLKQTTIFTNAQTTRPLWIFCTV